MRHESAVIKTNGMGRRKRPDTADTLATDPLVNRSAAPLATSQLVRVSVPARKKPRRRLKNDQCSHHPIVDSVLNPRIRISSADHDDIVLLLRTMNWEMAKNTSRRNVIRSDDPSTPRNHMNRPYCMSFIFGRNMKDPAGGLSWWSTQYPNVYERLRALMTQYDPTFSYTHITLNRNLRCKRHTDGGNAGPSYIAAFGTFSGGGLIVEPPGGGKPETMLDLRSHFVKFNGKTQPHETAQFTGERFTLVYYTSDITPLEGSVDRRQGLQAHGISTDASEGVSRALTEKFSEIKARLGRKRK